MPNPKRRHSRTRRDKRRTHWKLESVKTIKCNHCHQPKLPHRICPNCGYYNDRSVFLPRELS
ncbi:50S ribosomal protein L32 [bacterium]|nr:MAG: 50S ribosomal protein L32 [candidate division KSB1 bacterium]MCE7941190.1 50S ribosomal protein L32 [Chlorobi bacterium CHB1]MCL4705412.1 50S ribosomal protein L32 [bacterium]MDL1877464.1 50S ribosomal protein L32 [Cytophagia bacterium CHB2]MBC6951850.1 50S ribosomal protein L32 [candidate division KSB1 bacterium]